MAEIYQIDDSTRIRRMDSMNYIVEAYRKVRKKDGTYEMRWVGAKGDGYGPYFGNLGAAVRWVAENAASRSGAKDLKAFLTEYERVGLEIAGKVGAR